MCTIHTILQKLHGHVKVHPQGDQEYSVIVSLNMNKSSAASPTYTYLDDNQNYIVENVARLAQDALDECDLRIGDIIWVPYQRRLWPAQVTDPQILTARIPNGVIAAHKKEHLLVHYFDNWEEAGTKPHLRMYAWITRKSALLYDEWADNALGNNNNIFAAAVKVAASLVRGGGSQDVSLDAPSELKSKEEEEEEEEEEERPPERDDLEKNRKRKIFFQYGRVQVAQVIDFLPARPVLPARLNALSVGVRGVICAFDEVGDLLIDFEGHGMMTVLKSELGKLDIIDPIFHEEARRGARGSGEGMRKRRRIQASSERFPNQISKIETLKKAGHLSVFACCTNLVDKPTQQRWLPGKALEKEGLRTLVLFDSGEQEWKMPSELIWIQD